MHYRTAATALGLLTLIPLTTLNAADVWRTDLEAAQQLAVEQDKDLLILFTGTEWCVNCVEFERDILASPDFAAAAEMFVLVKLEYPAADDELPEKIRMDYVQWRERYGIQAFPTVILTDAAGRPYAGTTDIGLGPKEYVARLRELQKVRQRRDQALAKAAQAEGAEKAIFLDQALTALEQGVPDELTERQSAMARLMLANLLVRFYGDEIDQILAVKSEQTAGLRTKYQAILNIAQRVTEQQRQLATFAQELTRIAGDEGVEGAVKFIEKQLAGTPSKTMRNRLRVSQFHLLRKEERYKQAVAYAQQLVEDEAFPPREQRAIRRQIADLYIFHLGDVEKGAAIYDDLIAEVQDDPAAAWRFASFKAQRLAFADPKLSVKTWEDALQYVEPGTSNWAYNELMRARGLIRLDRHEEAEAVMTNMLSEDATSPVDRAVALVILTRAQSYAGPREDARKTAQRAEKALKESLEAGQINQAETEALRIRLATALNRMEQSAK